MGERKAPTPAPPPGGKPEPSPAPPARTPGEAVAYTFGKLNGLMDSGMTAAEAIERMKYDEGVE